MLIHLPGGYVVMSSFIQSTSGRLIAFSLALALIGGGSSVHLSATASLYVMSVSVFIAIVGCVGALQLAVEEHLAASIAAVILLPFLLFMYAVGLGVGAAFHPGWSYGFIALGIASLLVALRASGSEKRAPISAKPVMQTPAHAVER